MFGEVLGDFCDDDAGEAGPIPRSLFRQRGIGGHVVGPDGLPEGAVGGGELEIGFHQGIETVAGGFGQAAFEQVGPLAEGDGVDLEQQPIEGSEDMVDRANGIADAAGDFAGGESGEAALGQQCVTGIQDHLAEVFGRVIIAAGHGFV